MRSWDAARVAREAGAQLLAAPSGGGAEGGPAAACIDSRALAPGDLFVGLRGERIDGGSHAAAALRSGAWGVLTDPLHAEDALAAAGGSGPGSGGAVLTAEDPLAALQRLARAWARELREAGAKVVAITGSTGKTSTKDIFAALAGRELATAATPANLNTEIGLPLAILGAQEGTECLVLEMAMRGPGQIAELTAIAQPDVGVIVNVGPAHLELLGSLDAIAAAKAELIAGLRPGCSVVVPAGEPLLAPHFRDDVETITFGEGGDVTLLERRADGSVLIGDRGERIELNPSFGQAHNLVNLLAAVGAGRAIGLHPHGNLEVDFTAGRGQWLTLPGGVSAIDDCYNANPMSMRAAIDELAERAPGRRVAVLGDMLELGPSAPALHREIGAYAAARGVELLVTVGPLAAEMAGAFEGNARSVLGAEDAARELAPLLRPGDTVLIKGSRGVGLERTLAALQRGPAATGPGGQPLHAAGAGRGRR
jgi:UDP-N-acetylmuramoyl-tripeptide--D-alanyl-D-alanine ligase